MLYDYIISGSMPQGNVRKNIQNAAIGGGNRMASDETQEQQPANKEKNGYFEGQT